MTCSWRQTSLTTYEKTTITKSTLIVNNLGHPSVKQQFYEFIISTKDKALDLQ